MAGAIEFRRAGPSEAEAIRALTRRAYAKWVPLIDREPKPMTADYAAAVQNHRIDLLLVAGVLAGLVEIVDQGNGWLVENVAVEPDFQGRGLGSHLMAHAEEIARESGARRIWLYTNEQFAENIQFYQRLGYAIERREAVDERTVRVDMAKALSPFSRAS